jgi:hypothetical protein
MSRTIINLRSIPEGWQPLKKKLELNKRELSEHVQISDVYCILKVRKICG